MNENRFQTCRFYVLLFLALLTPLLYIEPGIFRIYRPDPFNFPKRYLVEIASLALFLIFAWELISRKKISMAWSKCLLPFFLFIAWTCISLIYAPSFHAGWREFIRWLCYGLIFLSALGLRPEGHRRKSLISAAAVSASAVSLIALMQFFGLDASFFKGGLHRVYSTLGNPNYVASYLAIILPVGYWGWIRPHGEKRTAVACLSFSLLGSAALLVTGSRGAIAALCAGVILSLLISPRPLLKKRLLILFILIFTLSILIFVIPPKLFKQYDTYAVKKLTGISGTSGRSIEWRKMVWKVSGQMIRERPILGNGPGSFRLLFLSHQAEILKRPENRSLASMVEWGIDFAHNDYLEIWVEFGLVGLALFVWFLASLLVSLTKAARMLNRSLWYGGAVLAGFFTLLSHGMVSFPFHIWPTAVTFFILSGLLVSARSSEKVINMNPLRQRVAAGVAAALIALAALSLMTSTIISEVYCSNGLRYFDYNQRSRAREEFSKAIYWQPHNGRAHFFLGLCLIGENRRPEAVREMLTALETYSRQPIHVQLGKLYGEAGKMADAERFLDTAIAMLPRDPDAWLVRGNLLLSNGDFESATQCFRQSLSFRPGSFEAARNLAIAYHALGREDEAIATYQGVLKRQPSDADIYVDMGAVWAQKGDTERARALWEKALSLDPENRNARENLKRLDKKL